jgi:hypothetical protein
MDDPGWSWPAWKFGLKRDDLFTSLHDQYNTFTFSLQDPQAFHADVYEIAHDANTAKDFHRLMADRRRQRLQELHDTLDSLAVEIIANPKLMASEHWDLALQLFRTKSFDSLVRYFASYIPAGYLDRSPSRSDSMTSSFSDAASVDSTNTMASTTASSVDDVSAHHHHHHHPLFTDGPVMTEEPCSLHEADCPEHEVTAPLSPPESEANLDVSASSPKSDDECHHSYTLSNAPSRSMSFSGSESEPFGPGFHRPMVHDDASSQSGDSDTAVTSVSDCEETRSSIESVDDDHLPPHFAHDEDEDDDLLTAQFPEDTFDAVDFINDTHESDDTPTPRPESVAACYVQYKSSCRRVPSPPRRSQSPSPKSHRSWASPPRDVRRSPEEALSKIQKSSLDPIRKRQKGRI